MRSELTSEAFGTLQDSPLAVFVVDAKGRIENVNAAAERLLSQGDTLGVIGGRLSSHREAVAEQLDAMLAAAMGSETKRPQSGSVRIPSEAGRPPVVLTAKPASSGRSPEFAVGVSIIVCATLSDASVSLPTDQMHAAFGLTPAECVVARALVEGLSVREASDSLGVSFNTVRTHVARIFLKTGVKRQSDLLRLLG